jgi:hypothetical protein
VSLVVGLVVATGGVMMGRWLAHRMRPRASLEAQGAADAPAPPGGEVFAGFPCRLGDVVVRTIERDEAWLAGALVFQEDRPIAALLIAPEAGADRAVFVRQGQEGLDWLSPLGESPIAGPGEPAHTIEHGGVRFERARRLPVRVIRMGSGAPHVGDSAIVAEYAGPTVERIVVVVGSEQTRSWRGTALGQRDYDVLPGDKTASTAGTPLGRTP